MCDKNMNPSGTGLVLPLLGRRGLHAGHHGVWRLGTVAWLPQSGRTLHRDAGRWQGQETSSWLGALNQCAPSPWQRGTFSSSALLSGEEDGGCPGAFPIQPERVATAPTPNTHQLYGVGPCHGRSYQKAPSLARSLLRQREVVGATPVVIFQVFHWNWNPRS